MNFKDDIRCGTDAGYRKHRRRGEEACADCRKAAGDHARAKREAEYEEENIELAGGEWRPDSRGIQRWHPATTVLERVETLEVEADRIRSNIDDYTEFYGEAS